MSDIALPASGTRRRPRLSLGGALKQLVLWIICAIALIPLYFLVVTSLKGKTDYLLNQWGPPLHPTLDNFATALADGSLLAETWHSVIVTVLSVAVCTIIAALAAYAFAQ